MIIQRNSNEVTTLCKSDQVFDKVVKLVGDIPLSLVDDPYVFLMNTLIEQMLSLKVANILRSRFKAICGGTICPENVVKITKEKLQSIGISKFKSEYILKLTELYLQGALSFDYLNTLPDDEFIKEFTKYPGVGPWTAKMYLIFVLNRQDVVPFEDGAFQQAFVWAYKPEQYSKGIVLEQSTKWHPYSTIVARYLYVALDKGYAKKPLD